MPDRSPAPGWWLASDGQWYAPELRPPADVAASGWPTGPSGPPPATHVGSDADPGLPRFGPAPAGAAPAGAPPPGYPPPGYPTPGYPQHAPLPPAGPSPVGIPGPTPGVPYGPPPDLAPPWQGEVTTNRLAVASLVLGILPIFGISSILAIIFGFVARGRIARSNGREKGAGLALAGIILGFVVLALVLVAVAIPTFLGVEHSRAGVEINEPAPIRLGSPIAGGSGPAIPWTSDVFDGDTTTVTPIPGGITMDAQAAGDVEHSALPISSPPRTSMALSGHVALTAGPADNGIGLGCLATLPDLHITFLVHRSGDWNIDMFDVTGEREVDYGTSSAIRGVGQNVVTIACSSPSGDRDTTNLDLEVNGTPVASDTIHLSARDWTPAVVMCTCFGPASGTFSDVRYSSGPG